MKINNMEILHVDGTSAARMQFIDTALDNGWSVRKRNDKYVFRKKHNGRTKVFEEAFLTEFIEEQSRACVKD